MSSSSGSLKVNLYFTLETTTIKVLEIPRAQFANYSFRPLKWLRFVGYAIYGAEGDIYEMEGETPVDYEVITKSEDLEDSYRFLSPHDPHLVDVNAFGDRESVTSSTMTTGRQNFREAILARDQGCVLTRGGDTSNNEACHILPFSKTHSYIKAVTKERSRSNNDVVEDVNGIRNGIMLLDCLHSEFGLGHFTFMVTPNFALGTADVPKTQPFRLPGDTDLPNDDGPRYTVQHFPGFDPRLTIFAPPGADALFPGRPDDKPSTIILDFWYGCLAVKAWGQASFREYTKENSNELYYSSGPDYISSFQGGSGRTLQATIDPALDRALDSMLGIIILQRRAWESRNAEAIEARRRQKESDERQSNIARVNDWRHGMIEDMNDES